MGIDIAENGLDRVNRDAVHCPAVNSSKVRDTVRIGVTDMLTARAEQVNSCAVLLFL
jgi:hypothetical protein